jgi:hypothetical protein
MARKGQQEEGPSKLSPICQPDITASFANSSKGSKYSVGDRVNYDPGGRSMLEGPFLIDEVLGGQRYILCWEFDRSLAYDGNAVEEDRLVKA